jgi:arginine decarboxylase
MLPKEYFLTSGSGESDTSPLNAFDLALGKARIAHCNLVPVSSIIPVQAVEVKGADIKPGSITFVVMAEARGMRGERISAGVAYIRPRGDRHGLVVESSGRCSKGELEEALKRELGEMCQARRFDFQEPRTLVEELDVKMRYGSALAALVFVPF